MSTPFRIGTRASSLALRQTNCVIQLLRDAAPDISIEIIQIKTTGDRINDIPLEKIGQTGLFTKEIEKALLENRIDAAVHSLKDLESTLPEELTIGAVPVREDVRDALISNSVRSLDELPNKARVLTGSLRRKAQLLHRRSDISVETIRGNIETRLKKFRESGADSLIMAAAGLIRLELAEYIIEYIPADVIVPAVGQGALAVEIRKNDARASELCKKINNPVLLQITAGERSFLRTLKGGCKVPVGCIGESADGNIILTGIIASPDGKILIKDSITAPFSSSENAGRRLAENILAAGGEEILEHIIPEQYK